MNTCWLLVMLVMLLSLAAGHPEAAPRRGGAHVRIRPMRRNSRKPKAKSRPKGISQTQYYYQPYYRSFYQPPYDPTGHGDPQFSYFQGK